MEDKFCKYCGEKIAMNAVVCTHCGRQVEELKSGNNDQPNIVINNSNMNNNANNNGGRFIGREKQKWVSILLCIFLGIFGAHKFYEGKTGLGILYLCTCGFAGIAPFIDFIILLFKPNPYYV